MLKEFTNTDYDEIKKNLITWVSLIVVSNFFKEYIVYMGFIDCDH